MRYALTTILLVHGMIHLIGFSAAFDLTRKLPLKADITKPIGVVWLLVAIAFITSAALSLSQKNWWFIGGAAIVCSQILVAITWTDTKWATLINIVLAIVVTVNLSGWLFTNAARQDAKSMFTNIQPPSPRPMAEMPPLVQKWLQRSGINDHTVTKSLRLKQKGMLRMKPGSKWLPVRAEQYFTVTDPSFVWIADVGNGLLPVSGADKYEHGKGNMLIKVLGMFPVVNAAGKEIDQGTALRYLAEIQWFPSAALSRYLEWHQTSDLSAYAIFTCEGISVTGYFSFNSEGDITAFEADRYMEHEGQYTIERWRVPVTEYRVFEGVRIPSKGKATWKLKSGNFDWFEWEITELEYNPMTIY